MIFLQAEVVDLPSILGLLKDGGLLAGTVILIFLLITDRIPTKGRLDAETERAVRAETQRDEALELAKSATQGMSELTTANKAVLEWAKTLLAGRESGK